MDEKAGWHHRLNGHGCEWTLRVGDGQGGLACCDSWGRKKLDMTERLNRTELKTIKLLEKLTGVNLHNFGFGNGFLDMTTKF